MQDNSSQLMTNVFVCDYIRTPFGRHGGGLAGVRTDDLAAIPIQALLARHPHLGPQAIGDVLYGCANQSGADNRNVARMALPLAGLPATVPGSTVNRLCGSSLDAAAHAARAIQSGDIDLLSKSDSAWGRTQKLEGTTQGGPFVNPVMKQRYGVDAMGETAENVAVECDVSRAAQDAFALRSQQRAASTAWLRDEITPVGHLASDEHPRPKSTLESLAGLKPVVRPGGTVTAGNASGINDRAAAVILASEKAASANGLTPMARILTSAVAGLPPRIMGLSPVPATQKIFARTNLKINQIGIIELNEAFAAQAAAVLRQLGLSEDAAHVNPHGGAIALGHPLGASGARQLGTAARQLQATKERYALCTMCVGVGQGIALLLERV